MSSQDETTAAAAAAIAAATPCAVSSGLVAVSVIFPLLSLLSIALRFKARKASSQALKAGDWAMLIAWIAAFGLSIMVWVFGGITGLDHYTKIDLKSGIMYSTMCVLIMAAYVQFPLSIVKISIFLFYKRTFASRALRVAVWVTIPLIVIWGIIFFVLVLRQSNPVRGSWTGEGHLVFDSFALGISQVATSIVLDVIILSFPLPIIFGLHLPGKRKVAIASIFWLGIFCCVAAAVRLYLVYTSTQQVIASEKTGEGFDAIYTQTKNLIFMILESNCSIIAGSLPCYGPLLKGGRVAESLVRSGRSVSSLRSNGGGGIAIKDQRGSSGTSDVQLKQVGRNWKSLGGSTGVFDTSGGQTGVHNDSKNGQVAGARDGGSSEV